MAISLALMGILRDGDEVINFYPCYPSYDNQIYLANRKVKIKNFIDFLVEKNWGITSMQIFESVPRSMGLEPLRLLFTERPVTW